jgi:hypothetical protein
MDEFTAAIRSLSSEQGTNGRSPRTNRASAGNANWCELQAGKERKAHNCCQEWGAAKCQQRRGGALPRRRKNAGRSGRKHENCSQLACVLNS